MGGGNVAMVYPFPVGGTLIAVFGSGGMWYQRGVAALEIFLATALKGAIFETIHQLKQRSLRRKGSHGGTGPEQPADRLPAQYLLTGPSNDIGARDQKRLERLLPRLGERDT